jgi:exosome complex exonuclease DIS3/RRP44
VIFLPYDRRVPRIRIVTQQAAALQGMCIVVTIDAWPETSSLPVVRALECCLHMDVHLSGSLSFGLTHTHFLSHTPIHTCVHPDAAPQGHYVRTLGKAGDVPTETEAVLIEHDVPYEPFSAAVRACVWGMHAAVMQSLFYSVGHRVEKRMGYSLLVCYSPPTFSPVCTLFSR